MKVSEQLKEILKHKDISITQLAKRMNTSQPNVTTKLSRDNLKLSDLQELATALDYTSMEIVLRGKKEDVVILEDRVEYKKHNLYMMPDKTASLIEDIDKNGFRDTTFRTLLLEVICEKFEPEFERIFGDTLDSYVPNDFKSGFKDVIRRDFDRLDLINTKSEEN